MPRTHPTRDARSTTDRRVPPAARSASAVLPASAELLRSQNRVLELVARGAPLHETLDVFLRSIEAQSPGRAGPSPAAGVGSGPIAHNTGLKITTMSRGSHLFD